MTAHLCLEYPCPVCTRRSTGTPVFLHRRSVPDSIRYIARQARDGALNLPQVALILYALADDIEDEVL